ncbi:MAG: hypothetical protein K9H48_07800 [Melioribacteraceae bacterium]|nr:hypothetical protein [Melioribacteraceae bacterium]
MNLSGVLSNFIEKIEKESNLFCQEDLLKYYQKNCKIYFYIYNESDTIVKKRILFNSEWVFLCTLNFEYEEKEKIRNNLKTSFNIFYNKHLTKFKQATLLHNLDIGDSIKIKVPLLKETSKLFIKEFLKLPDDDPNKEELEQFIYREMI